MERAGAFTGVPGWGGVAMGFSALLAAWMAHLQPTLERWLLVWLAEGWLAFAIGCLAMIRKASAGDTPLTSRPGRRFVLAYTPPILVGALRTAGGLAAASGLEAKNARPIRRPRRRDPD